MLKFTTYFTENTTIIVLLGGTRRAKSELPDANDQVLPPKHKLETQECVISFTFNSLIGFFGIVNTFTWICKAISGQKSRATSLPFLKVVNITWNIFIGSSSATLTSGQYSSLQPAESWLVYSNFGHAGYIQGRLLAFQGWSGRRSREGIGEISGLHLEIPPPNNPESRILCRFFVIVLLGSFEWIWRFWKRPVSTYENQAHITMSVQLPHFPATAFSQTDLFLTWIYREFIPLAGTSVTNLIHGLYF